MEKKEVLELKRRFTKENCTFTRMSGCYVDAEKNKVLKLNDNFLNLDDELFYKYLDIAKKTLSGKVGDNILTFEFPTSEEITGGKQQFLMGMRDSKLKNEDLLDTFYDLVIDNYEYVGNYLILVFHDVYDVMTKTSDNKALDESEEVYEYLLCAICPVKLSKPGLGYLTETNEIGARERDWVVTGPETGFVFPTFNDRSSDIHAITFYTKDTKEPHREFMEDGLGVPTKKTATEQRKAFEAIVEETLDLESDTSAETYLELQDEIGKRLEDSTDSISLTAEDVGTIMEEIGLSKNKSSEIIKKYRDEFKEEVPLAETIYDEKFVEKNKDYKKMKELEATIEDLTIQVKGSVAKDEIAVNIGSSCSNKASIKIVDGVECVVIPKENADKVTVNGKEIV